MWHFYLGTLIPISRTVTETLNSDYEVTLERLIDDAGKWTQTLLIDSSMIFVGDYTAGIDIKPGTYVITCTKAKEHASDGMTIAIYEPGENYKVNKNKSVYYEFRDNAKAFIGIDFGGSAIISLQEGEHLIIRWGEGTLRSFTPSWAP